MACFFHYCRLHFHDRSASSHLKNNNFGTGATINIHVSNRAKTKDPTQKVQKEQQLSVQIETNEDNNPDSSEMPPPPPSPVSEKFQTLQLKFNQEHQLRIKVQEELLEVQSVAENQLDEIEENKHKAIQFLQSINWSYRAIQTFLKTVYGNIEE